MKYLPSLQIFHPDSKSKKKNLCYTTKGREALCKKYVEKKNLSNRTFSQALYFSYQGTIIVLCLSVELYFGMK